MKKVKVWLRNYFSKSSKLKIAGDLVFWIFVILLIIPVTRREITTVVIKATLRKPKVQEERVVEKMNEENYDLLFTNLEGRTISLEDYQGEVIFLNFWATWCPPCRAEMPSIQKLYNDYSDRIAFILVSNEEKQRVEEYFNEFNYSLPVYTQRSALPDVFNVKSIPTTYLINRSGEIILEKTGAADWNADAFRNQLDAMVGQ